MKGRITFEPNNDEMLKKIKVYCAEKGISIKKFFNDIVEEKLGIKENLNEN